VVMTREVQASNEKAWLQIVVALLSRRERPDIPEDPSSLPGGTFDGVWHYIDLMRRCWSDDPEERPAFETVTAELRNLADQARMSRLSAARRNQSGTLPKSFAPCDMPTFLVVVTTVSLLRWSTLVVANEGVVAPTHVRNACTHIKRGGQRKRQGDRRLGDTEP
jgi:hypothetical protein